MNALLLGVEFFLGVSLLFYILFAGADFGAGILELFLKSREPGSGSGSDSHSGPGASAEAHRQLISHAMAPVWEANHVWLVLAVTILFMAFPMVYAIVSIHLFIPILAILVGIVGRGAAFTFRHYDTLTKTYYRSYSMVFALSSLWTSFFLGVIAGSLSLGRINPHGQNFYDLYIHPWLSWHNALTGIFACCLFALLASVYLIGESKDENLRSSFRRKASLSAIAMVLSGGLVFLSGEAEGLGLMKKFFTNQASVLLFGIATVLLVPMWRSLHRQSTFWVRLLGALIVSCVILGWYAVQYPAILLIQTEGGYDAVTFTEAAAPEATLRILLGALIVGSLLIFPSLAYLFKVFKWETIDRVRTSSKG